MFACKAFSRDNRRPGTTTSGCGHELWRVAEGHGVSDLRSNESNVLSLPNRRNSQSTILEVFKRPLWRPWRRSSSTARASADSTRATAGDSTKKRAESRARAREQRQKHGGDDDTQKSEQYPGRRRTRRSITRTHGQGPTRCPLCKTQIGKVLPRANRYSLVYPAPT